MPIIEYHNGQVVYQPLVTQGIYPVWSFPACIGDAINEVSMNLGLPVESAAHSALGEASLVCQHFINVQCSPYPPASVSLFLIIINNTSGGKSLCEQKFSRASKKFEREQDAKFEAAMLDYRAEMEIWKDDGRRLAKEYREATKGTVEANDIRAQRIQHEKNRPIEPRKWELRYEEMSPAGLRDALVVNQSIGILSPDAGPALNGMTFSQTAMLSGYWSGEDRPVGLASGSRRPVEPRLTISVMAQWDQFALFMKNRGSEAFGTGLLGRFLVASPQTIEQPGQEIPSENLPEPKLDQFNQRVTAILNQPLPAPSERLTLKLSDSAKLFLKLFREWVHDVLICGDFSDDMKSFFRKIGQQSTRLAALFHYFDGAAGDISPDAMRGAIAVCEWYLFECIRVFTSYAPPQQQQDAEAAQNLLEWLQEATANPGRYRKLTPYQYAERDIRNYSSFRGNPKALEKAINALCQQGAIAVRFGPKGGRIIFYQSSSANPMQLICNASFNRASVMSAQNPTFPMQSCNVVGNNDTLNYGRQEAPCSEEVSDQFVNQDDIECDSVELRRVKQHLENSAIEAGIGPVNLSVRLNRS